jgi:hypothetical protein
LPNLSLISFGMWMPPTNFMTIVRDTLDQFSHSDVAQLYKFIHQTQNPIQKFLQKQDYRTLRQGRWYPLDSSIPRSSGVF